MKKLLLIFMFFTILLFLNINVNSQNVIYSQDFEPINNPTGIDWNSFPTNTTNNNNYWVWGIGIPGATLGAATHTGEGALQIWGLWNNAWYANYWNWNTFGYNRRVERTFDFSAIQPGSNLIMSYWLLVRGETNYDDFRVTVNGNVFDGPLTNINNWQQRFINLSMFEGNNNVTISFEWRNDGSIRYNPGARVDDIVIYVENPLPVELDYFILECSDNISLEWKTFTELNSSHWIIEGSDDGDNYIELDKLSGQGTTTEETVYYYVTRNIFNYYRLKQVDFDGQYEYFGPISSNCGEENIKIFPNPTTNKISITGNTSFETLKISMIDNLGRIIYNKNINTQSNIFYHEIDVSQYPPGTYVVKINNKFYNIVKI